MGKMSSTGVLQWINQYQILSGIGGLRRATDGSGDFLVSTSNPLQGYDNMVLRINQAGALVTMYNYELPQQNFTGGLHCHLGVHPDGDFSMVFSAQDNFPPVGDKYFIRCQPNGQPRVAKKLVTSGSNTFINRARYFPGDGWLICDKLDFGDN